jgi:hypothetical protein
MEGDSNWSPDDYTKELDRPLASVMPESWEGHSRLALARISDGLSPEEYRFAERLAERVHKPGHAEKVAEAAKEKTLEKLR